MPQVLQDYYPDDPKWRISAAAYLTLLSAEESPDVLEGAVGLEPDEKWSKGDPRRGGGKRPFTGLEYGSGLDEKQSPSDHVAALTNRLRPYAEGVAAVSRRPLTHSVTLWVVEHTNAGDRQIELQPGDLRTLAAMRARLSLDLYFYGDDTS